MVYYLRVQISEIKQTISYSILVTEYNLYIIIMLLTYCFGILQLQNKLYIYVNIFPKNYNNYNSILYIQCIENMK